MVFECSCNEITQRHSTEHGHGSGNSQGKPGPHSSPAPATGGQNWDVLQARLRAKQPQPCLTSRGGLPSSGVHLFSVCCVLSTQEIQVLKPSHTKLKHFKGGRTELLSLASTKEGKPHVHTPHESHKGNSHNSEEISGVRARGHEGSLRSAETSCGKAPSCGQSWSVTRRWQAQLVHGWWLFCRRTKSLLMCFSPTKRQPEN